MRYKSGKAFLQELRKCADSFATFGPNFANVWLDGKLLIRREELRRMYKDEFKLLTPAQRLERVRATLETRMASWEASMYKQYEKQFEGHYHGRELTFVSKMAVSQRLQPVRAQLRAMLEIKGPRLLTEVLRDAPRELRELYKENCEAGLTWWEDAVAEAWLMVRLGFAAPDKSIYHLLVDEAQDYSETALSLLVALPSQRACDASGRSHAAHLPGHGRLRAAPTGATASAFRTRRCFRSAAAIAPRCPSPGCATPFFPTRSASSPLAARATCPWWRRYSLEAVQKALAGFRAAGHHSIAVITRTQKQAEKLCEELPNVYRFDGGEDDQQYENGDTVVGCYHLMKGLEFDAVIVAWPDAELTDDERRRLYTACSRALHAAALLADENMLEKLGIVL